MKFRNYLFTFCLFTATLWLALPTPVLAQLVNPVKDSLIQFTDITTNNASSSKHGFLPKLDNTGTKYLRDDGTWATVIGGFASLGNLDAVSETSKGASSTGSILYMQSASALAPGLVNTTTQSFAGAKSFTAGTITGGFVSNTTVVNSVFNGGSVSGASVSDTTIIGKDTAFTLVDDGNASRKLAFQLGNLSTNTTRTITIPNFSFTPAAVDQNQSWTGLPTFGGGLTASATIIINGATTFASTVSATTNASLNVGDDASFVLNHSGGKRTQFSVDAASSNTTVTLTTPAATTTLLGMNAATTKGDILAATASNAISRVGVGANGTALVADSASTNGVKWSALGETVVSSSTTANHTITADQWGDIASISVTSGAWTVNYSIQWLSNGVVTTAYVSGGASVTSGNSTTGLTFGHTYVSTNKATPSDSRDFTGGSIYLSVSNTTTVYLKGFAATSITNLQRAGIIRAIRVGP